MIVTIIQLCVVLAGYQTCNSLCVKFGQRKMFTQELKPVACLETETVRR